MKLVQSKKPGERKAVKKAYEDAIVHRCRVTGQISILTGEGAEEEEEVGRDLNNVLIRPLDTPVVGVN